MHGREYSGVDGLIAEIKDSDCTIWRKKTKKFAGGEMHFFMCQELAGRIISQALEIKNDGDKKRVVSVLKEKLLLVEKQFHQSKWHELDEKDRKCFGVKQDYLDHFLEFTKNDRRLSMRMQYVLGGAHAEPSRFVKQNYSRFLRHLGLVRKKRSSSDAFDSRMLSSFKMLHSISRGVVNQIALCMRRAVVGVMPCLRPVAQVVFLSRCYRSRSWMLLMLRGLVRLVFLKIELGFRLTLILFRGLHKVSCWPGC